MARWPDDPMTLRHQLEAAIEFATQRHHGQTRQDAAKSPYIDVTDEPVLVAAALHDTVEDTPTTFAEIEEQFGARVAGFVREMTDDKGLAKDVRKALQIDHAPRLSDGAKQIKIADKIANVRDITHTPPAHWPEIRKDEYFDWAERVVAGCRGVNAGLERAFDAAVAAARIRARG
jgi:guanosine-3',5'-bis(diphosphate) 3'-pyrophosphohydrolase